MPALCEKVIYINTFSKSLTPTIRISYMVLPPHLANRFYETMSFYACTVSNFEQYTLAEFIRQGCFEKHINRMRLFYRRRRQTVIDEIQNSPVGKLCTIIENDSGLHFLLKVNVDVPSERIKRLLLENGIGINALGDYYLTSVSGEDNQFIINYSTLTKEKISAVLKILEGLAPIYLNE